ncbi:hypothetical protein [Leptolyngbya sp. FACHB-261]|uniref:hypothetical protein n=1 Tax=Leptolyngbya sp. FACHB-261 TaxID=2692806 RepID=UPI0016859968|nr:hypothetical protein [Leptolyngbya sp. FACHB-261]MBD2105315.1 hypothetical protein [Leptolyngbya sp. FACHB-261]
MATVFSSPLDAEYKERLAAWVQDESRQLGSERQLALQLGLAPRALQKWRNGELIRGLSEASLDAIAQYRRKKETQPWTSRTVRDWLTGQDEVPQIHSKRPITTMGDLPKAAVIESLPAREWVQHAPIEEVLAVIQDGLQRLEREWKQRQSE